jgi:transcriptional regulator with XRE-family HTH domain
VTRIGEVDKSVGQRIRERRVELGLTQQNLSGITGVSYQQIQKYERGSNRISAGMLWTLCDALKVAPDYFYEQLDARQTRRGLSDAVKRARKMLEPRAGTDDETIEFLTAYKAIRDATVRRGVRGMIRSLAKSTRPTRARKHSSA